MTIKESRNRIWCGCASAVDGFIEETHTYAEAQNADFHHSLYFSPEAAERISEGESVFFWLSGENGVVETDWRYSKAPKPIVDKIKKNINTIC